MTDRSSCSKLFFKIGALKNFAIFYNKTPLLESFVNKFAVLKACNFIKKRHQHKCFPVNIAKLSKTAFL